MPAFIPLVRSLVTFIPLLNIMGPCPGNARGVVKWEAVTAANCAITGLNSRLKAIKRCLADKTVCLILPSLINVENYLSLPVLLLLTQKYFLVHCYQNLYCYQSWQKQSSSFRPRSTRSLALPPRHAAKILCIYWCRIWAS